MKQIALQVDVQGIAEYAMVLVALEQIPGVKAWVADDLEDCQPE